MPEHDLHSVQIKLGTPMEQVVTDLIHAYALVGMMSGYSAGELNDYAQEVVDEVSFEYIMQHAAQNAPES